MSSSQKKTEEDKANTSNEPPAQQDSDNVKVTTTEIPMQGYLIKLTENETNKVNVRVPIVPVDLPASDTSLDSEPETIVVPAIQKKTVTTIKKICPKRVQELVVEKLDPIVTETQDENMKITEVKTPIKKTLTTATTINKTTLVKTETTIIVGPEGAKDQKK